MAGERLTLQTVLKQHNVKKLRKIASGYYVKGASKMRKDELVSALEQQLLRSGNLDELLLMAGDIGWQLIQDVAVADDLLQVPAKALKYARMFAELGYLQYEGDEQAGTVNMPVEVKELLSTMKKEGYYERKSRADLLFAYSQAAANLYGVVDQEELVDIINRQVEKKTDIGELMLCQIRHLEFNALYCHLENYLVSIIFKKNNFEDIPNILAATAGKPRYVPTKETFLLYSDGDYYEKTAHTAHFRAALTDSWGIPTDEAEKIVAEIVFYFQVGAGLSDALKILSRRGLVLRDNMLPTLTSMIAAVHDSTRLWANKGYTPNELAQMQSKLSGNNSKQIPGKIKISRNSPCPCGSGRKYKKCCGR